MIEVVINPNTSLVEVLNEPIVIEIGGGLGSGGSGGIGGGENVGAGDGVFKQVSGTNLQFKTLLAGSNITLTPAANTITISAPTPTLDDILSDSDDAGGNTITNLGAPVGASDAARLQDIPTSLPPSGAAGGDLTGSYPNPTLAAVIGLTPGTYGSGTHYPTFTVDAKGRITVASQLALPSGISVGSSAGGDLTGTYPNPSIQNNAVTYAKIQQVTANRLLGRVGSNGSVQEIQLGAGLEFDGTVLQVNEFDALGWLIDGNATTADKKIGSTTAYAVSLVTDDTERIKLHADGTITINGVLQDNAVTEILALDGDGNLVFRDADSIGGFVNPMTSIGDLIVGTTDGAPARLGIGTSGQVLTSNGTTIEWSSASAAVFTGDVTFVLSSGKSFGKYLNGQTAAWTGLTAIEAIEDAALEYIDPVFTSFSVTGQATTVEVGTTLSGSKTFTWAITENSGDVDDIDIYDNTAASTLLAATPNDGTQSQTVTTIQLNTNGATQSWKAIGNNSDPVDTFDSSNFVVTGRFYRFYGPSATTPANSADVRALPSSAFQTSDANTFTLNTGTTEDKFVVALPPGVDIATVIDLDAFDTDITSEYISLGTITVDDAGSTGRTYNLYEMNLGGPYSSNHRHQITTV